MLISSQSEGKDELLKKIYDLEQANDDKDFEAKALTEKNKIIEEQLSKLKREYEQLETQLSSQISSD